MKSNLLVLSVVAVLTLMASSGFAGVTMRVSVPFDFYAGDQQLPAGEYTFEMGSGLHSTASVVTLRAKEGIWFMPTQAGTTNDLSLCQLQFNRYGDKHFLSAVLIRGIKAGLKPVKLGRELRAQGEKDRSAVTIAQK